MQKQTELHAAQYEYTHSDALFRGFVGGRGSGKSYAGAYDLIRRAKRGRLYLAASPTYTVLADTTLRMFRRVAAAIGAIDDTTRRTLILRPEDVKVTPPSARLTTGAEIIFRSAEDPERMRGPNLSGAWLDEASLMHRDAHEIVIACLREEGEQGWYGATFTPKGLSHWTYEIFGQNKPNTSIVHWRTRDNPFNPPGFAETLALQYSGLRAQQELDGAFVNVEGAEWPPEYFPDSIWFNDWPKERGPLRVIALDPSKGKDAHRPKGTEGKKVTRKEPDYSAFVMVQLDITGTLWVDAVLERIDSVQIVENCFAFCRDFAPNALAIETNQFQELLARDIIRLGRERQRVLPVWGITNTLQKEVRLRTIGPYLAQGKLRFKHDSPGARLLVQQLQDFPCGAFDDGPDALEMALRMLMTLLGQKDKRDRPKLMGG